jgi:hypothetical protein
VRRWLRFRLPVAVAAALLAAGLGDPLVESLSGTGIFGAGYADQNHLGVVPVLVAAATVLAAWFVVRCSDGLRRALRGERVANVAAASGSPALGADLALVVALQLAVVFLMEFAEAALAGTPLQGGVGWLGAPLGWALALYASVALVALFGVHRFARAMCGACARIVRAALEVLASAPRAAHGPLVEARTCDRHARHQTLIARNSGGRAPPSLRPI